VRARSIVNGVTSYSNWRSSTVTAYVPGIAGGVPNDQDVYALSWSGTYTQYLDTDGTFTLNWPAASAPYNQYYYFRQYTPDNQVYSLTNYYTGQHEFSRTFTLLPDGYYTFAVEGCYWQMDEDDLYGWDECNSRFIYIRVHKLPPPTPSWLDVPEDSSSGWYTVSWAGAANAVYYELEEQLNTGGWTAVSLDTPLQTSKVFGDINTGTYEYRVRACLTSALCSAWTHPQQIEVAIAPAQPTFIDVTPVLGDGDLAVTWGASPSGVAVGYYDLDEYFDGDDTWNDLGAFQNLTTSFNRPVGGYLYRVSACNSAGTFIRCSGRVYSNGALVALPDAPTLNAPVSTADTSYQLSWNAVGNLNHYELYERIHGNTAWGTPIYSGVSTLHQIQNKPQGRYDYRLDACNTLGCTASNIVTTEVIGPPGVPGSIQGPDTNDDGSYILSWAAPISGGPVGEYQLEQQHNSGDWESVYQGNALITPISVYNTGAYGYRVQACNTAGCSSYTAAKIVNVTASTNGTVATPQTPVLADASQFNIDTQAIDQTLSTDGEFNVGKSGQASYTIQILTAPAGGNLVPEVSLGYSSGGGNGLVGYGWSLNGLGGISRCRQTLNQDDNAAPITWSAEDRFCLNGERLLVDSQYSYGAVGATYKTELDSYVRITSVGGTTGHPDHFKVEHKNGITEFYGATNDAQYVLAPGRILTWALNRREDSAGNRITYLYTNDPDGQRIDRIEYAFDDNNNSVANLEFIYEDRSDPISGYVAGPAYRTGKRLKTIQSNSDGLQLREYRLHYNEGAAANAPDQLGRLTSIEECVDSICLQPIEFEWSLPTAAVIGCDRGR
jgi:hypothetical protein